VRVRRRVAPYGVSWAAIWVVWAPAVRVMVAAPVVAWVSRWATSRVVAVRRQTVRVAASVNVALTARRAIWRR
jgi:hypothetical protein